MYGLQPTADLSGALVPKASESTGGATWEPLTAEEEMATGYNLEVEAWHEETSPPQYQWTPEMPYPQYPQGPTSAAPSTVPSPREREGRQGKYARPLPIPQPSIHDAPPPFFRHQSQKDWDEENARREAWAAELLESWKSEYFAPVIAEANQATAEVEARVLCVEDT